MVTPQFLNVGSNSAMPLQSIIPTGDGVSDTVVIQTLDQYGYTVDSYAWIDWAGENSDEEGWVDDNFEIVEGVTFAAGQGLWVEGSRDDWRDTRGFKSRETPAGAEIIG